MTDKHTPGPWTLTHVSGDNFSVQEFSLRGMFGGSPNIYPIFNRNTSAIDGATFCASPHDARLIAAAPDLLAAANMLLAGLPDETFQVGARLRKAEVEHLNAAILMFKSATAKAEGR